MGTKPYLIAALIACAPATVSAYYLETRGTTTEPVRFTSTDVEYRINTTSFPAGLTGGEEAIDAAFQTWTDADCSTLVFNDGGTSDVEMFDHWMNDAGAIYVLVYFTDTLAEWGNEQAVGHFVYGFNPSGELIGGSVVLNSRDHTWATDGSTGALDVQSIATALIGRALGITSTMEGNATYPVYEYGDTTKRTLGTDDLAAIQYLYVDASCAPPADPEAVCAVTDVDCPPPVVTMPPDGGVPPREDAGITPMPDAGTTPTDSGTGGTSDGCGCRAAGTPTSAHSGALVLSIMLGLVLFSRRRRS